MRRQGGWTPNFYSDWEWRPCCAASDFCGLVCARLREGAPRKRSSGEVEVLSALAQQLSGDVQG